MGEVDAKQQLKDLCSDVCRAQIENGRLKRPKSMRNLRRWVSKNVLRWVGLSGVGLKRRWLKAAMAMLLAGGLFLSAGTEAKAAVSFVSGGIGNPFNGVDVGSYSSPVFADIDDDGDLDSFVGERFGTIKYYVNNGSGVFTEQTGAWNATTKAGNPFNGVDVGSCSAPAFEDIDGDGDLDAFVGEGAGTINYYVNDGSGVFTEQTGAWNATTKAGNPFNGVDVGDYSVPSFEDIDGDGDLDAFIGEYFGTIKYYVNDSSGGFTEQTGDWSATTKAGNPFNGVDVGSYSKPAFADIDGDGDLDAFVGEGAGTIKYYVNNSSGGFTVQTGAWNATTKAGNPFNGVDVGIFSAPAFADIDGDGDLDAFIGEWEGNINYFVNNSSGGFTGQTDPWTPVINPFEGVDVGSYSAPAFADIDGDGDLDAFVGKSDGTINYYVNDSSGGFTEQTGAWNATTKAGNPFNGIGVDITSTPAFADIDDDGDLDAFVGNWDGTIKYYVNNGNGVFTEQTGAWNTTTKAGNPFNGVDVSSYITPAFADIDGDGDLDAFSGENYGYIKYYVNNGSGVFTEQPGAWDAKTKAGNPFNGVNVGWGSAPSFADIDGDGDLEAFVGEGVGNINYFVNNGSGFFTEQTGVWNATTKAGNPFNDVDVGIFCRPAFADMDGDGDMDAFIGDGDGTITYFKNMNNPPTDISLDDSSVNQSGGVNAVVGNLSGTDPDAGDSVTIFTLVAGDGDTDNALFNISGTALRANDAGNMPGRNYLVRVRGGDGNGGGYSEVFIITVVDDVCSYNASPTTATFGHSGGSGTINVTSTGCSWNATNNAPSWITITSGGSGSGNSAVSYSVSPNWTTQSRQGTIVVAGKTVTITQAGTTCTYSLSPSTSPAFTAGGGTALVNLITQSGCNWAAQPNNGWIGIESAGSGTGSGSIIYSVAGDTGAARTGTISISGQTFTIQQSGTAEWICPSLNPVKYGSSYDYTIQSAYDNAAPGETIMIQAADYVEQLELDRPVSVTLTGGYDCNYVNNNLVSEIYGTMTISDGTVTVNWIMLK